MTTTTFEAGDNDLSISTSHTEGDEVVVRTLHTHYFVTGVLLKLQERANEDGAVEGWTQPVINTLEEAHLTGKWLLQEIDDDDIPDDVDELDEELLREIQRTIVPVAASLGVEIDLQATGEQLSLSDRLPLGRWSW
jgi:hypothetical protein